MRRAVAITVLLATAAAAKINLVTVAAVTTIAINALEIKTTIQRARAAAKATKKVAAKMVKKVTGGRRP